MQELKKTTKLTMIKLLRKDKLNLLEVQKLLNNQQHLMLKEWAQLLKVFY